MSYIDTCNEAVMSTMDTSIPIALDAAQQVGSVR